MQTLASDIDNTLNKHADFYQKSKAYFNDADIAQSLNRMKEYVFVRPINVSTLRDSSHSLLQAMEDRCDEESRRRASVVKRTKVLFSRKSLEEDICDLQGRLKEERRRWKVS